MDLGLKGRRALVTGSSGGTGAAIAKALAREGVEVLVHGRSAQSAMAVKDEIEARGGKAAVLLADLLDPVQVDRLAAQALATGPVDILINCAGAAHSVQNWDSCSVDGWNHQYQLSTLYAVQLIKALTPGMRDRGWGRVLNVSSAAGFRPTPLNPEYAAAKLALHTIATSLSIHLGESGVTVNTLVSGLVLTEPTLATIRKTAAQFEFTETGAALERRVVRDVWKANIPLGRAGTVDELAASACFLVSQAASYITGAALRVDGGVSAFVQ